VLLKDGSAGILRHAIDEIKAGRRFMAPEVLEKVADNQLELTPREFQILKLIYDGLSNNEIAQQLNLSPKTTDKHRENMMRKLQVNNATQLLKKVIELGLLKSSC
jgi:DNA-binding NarL/FixJ family response regulator